MHKETAIFALLLALMFATGAAPASATPLTLPFDFSRHVIELAITVKGKPLTMLLDTGVNPSVIDLKRAEALRLPLNRRAAGEGNGEGGGHTEAIPSRIQGLAIGGRKLGDAEALATDLSGLSASYGRALDGILGYSFLRGKTVAVDYSARTVTFYASSLEAAADTRQCRLRYTMPFESFGDEQFPVIRNFRFGTVTAPVTLDTGSNRTIGLYRSALQRKEIRAALDVKGSAQGSSFGGSYTTKDAILNIPAGIGPFAVPPGLPVSLMPGEGSPTTRIANVGNRLLAAMKVKLLFDYAGKRIALLGDCAANR